MTDAHRRSLRAVPSNFAYVAGSRDDAGDFFCSIS
jgi:hypothetical protein